MLLDSRSNETTFVLVGLALYVCWLKQQAWRCVYISVRMLFACELMHMYRQIHTHTTQGYCNNSLMYQLLMHTFRVPDVCLQRHVHRCVLTAGVCSYCTNCCNATGAS